MSSPIVFGGPPLWFWLFAVIATAVVSAVVAVVVVVVLRSMMRGGGWRGPWGGPRKGPGFGPPPWDHPEQVLARRFANGEIDEEEFRRRLEVLRSWRRERHGNWEHGSG